MLAATTNDAARRPWGRPARGRRDDVPCSRGAAALILADVSDSERARFLAELGEARRRELTAAPGWEARLDAALDAATAEAGASWLSRDELAAELGRRLGADPGPAEPWWRHLNPPDLHLAAGCARGVAAAIEKLESVYGRELRSVAGRFARQGVVSADDLLQLLRNRLFLGSPEPTDPPRIASYTGQGSLRNWLRVTATRAFIDAVRSADARNDLPIADELVAMLPDSGADPELELLKRQNLAHFKHAFAEAVAALDSSDRVVLRQHLVEHLSIDQIGALYHMHRATAARRVVKAKDALLAATRAAMAQRMGLGPDDLASVLALIASRMEASVERLLRD
jgi:RNA polymerase sigma-70 factor (ECF subfamily)